MNRRWSIDFIVQKFGLESLKQILADLRDGQEINIAIRRPHGSAAGFGKAIRRLRPRPGQIISRRASIWTTAAGASPDRERRSGKTLHPEQLLRADAKGRRNLMEAKKWAEAKPLLESHGRRSYHGEKGAENPLWLLAVTERNLDDTNAELATLQKFADAGGGFRGPCMSA